MITLNLSITEWILIITLLMIVTNTNYHIVSQVLSRLTEIREPSPKAGYFLLGSCIPFLGLTIPMLVIGLVFLLNHFGFVNWPSQQSSTELSPLANIGLWSLAGSLITCFIFWKIHLTRVLHRPNANDIAHLQPLWAALSDLYLDSPVGSPEFKLIATQIRAGGWTLNEARRIDREQVGPYLYANLWNVAGAWGAFDPRTLTLGIEASLQQRSLIRDVLYKIFQITQRRVWDEYWNQIDAALINLVNSEPLSTPDPRDLGNMPAKQKDTRPPFASLHHFRYIYLVQLFVFIAFSILS